MQGAGVTTATPGSGEHKARRNTVAGIDLRRDPDGTWWCFEVNPSPGYSFFQEQTGQRIDRAIARLLASADAAAGLHPAAAGQLTARTGSLPTAGPPAVAG